MRKRWSTSTTAKQTQDAFADESGCFETARPGDSAYFRVCDGMVGRGGEVTFLHAPLRYRKAKLSAASKNGGKDKDKEQK